MSKPITRKTNIEAFEMGKANGFEEGYEMGKKDAMEEVKKIKENYLRDLKECAKNGHIKHWIWLNATIDELEEELNSKSPSPKEKGKWF